MVGGGGTVKQLPGQVWDFDINEKNKAHTRPCHLSVEIKTL